MTGVALMGAGFMGSVHARAWRSLADRAQVRVVCARNLSAARDLAAPLDADVCASWEEAITREDVSLVDICLPTPLHRPVAERALGSGKDVILEKPVALSLRDADAIADAARESGRVAMVGHVARFAPEVIALRGALESGRLGPPVALSALRFSAPPDWNGWMLDPDRSGGVAVDLMVHDFDLAAALLGPPRQVVARVAAGGRHVAALVEYERGEAKIEGSHALPAQYPFTSELRVVCQRGVVEHAFRAAPPEDGNGNLGGPATAELRLFAEDAPPQTLATAADDPWTLQLATLLDAVQCGTPLRDGTLDQASTALATALATQRSLWTGRPEPVLTHVEESR